MNQTTIAERELETLRNGEKIKDYQAYENQRNKRSTQLFHDMLRAAFGELASEIIIAHHLNFEHGSDIGTINEIPSADTLIFDHEIMGRIFGKEMALKHMMLLATVPVERRDNVLEILFRNRIYRPA